MHTPRIYVAADLAPNTTVTIEGGKHHHLRNVLRLKAADAVILFIRTIRFQLVNWPWVCQILVMVQPADNPS